MEPHSAPKAPPPTTNLGLYMMVWGLDCSAWDDSVDRTSRHFDSTMLAMHQWEYTPNRRHGTRRPGPRGHEVQTRSLRRVGVNLASIEVGREHAGTVQVERVDRENIPVQHDEISELTGL
jgi:hypothetical protein